MSNDPGWIKPFQIEIFLSGEILENLVRQSVEDFEVPKWTD